MSEEKLMCTELKSLLESGRVLNISTNGYEGEEAVKKYALAIVFNNFTELKRDQIDLVKFNKKRTKLTEEQLKQAELNARDIKERMYVSIKEFTKELEIIKEKEKNDKFIEAELKTIDVDGIMVKESEFMDQDNAINNFSIASYVVKHYRPFMYGSNYYYYNNGIYILDDCVVKKSKVGKIIGDIIEKVYTFEQLENKRLKVIDEIHSIIMRTTRTETDPFDLYDDMICVANGVLKFNWDSKTYELLPHSTQYIFRTKYAFNIDPSLDTSDVKLWLSRLSTDRYTGMIKTETYNKLIEMAAAPIVMQLTQSTFKSSYLVKGEKDSGKTTFIEEFLKIRFFGKDACSSTPFKALCEDRFGKDSLIGKTVNICDDLPNSVTKNVSAWKQLTGGGRTQIESKYKSKIDVFMPMFIFSSNSYPKISGIDGDDIAFWERWQLVEMNNKFEQNVQYAGTVQQYVSAFALLVIEEIFKLKTIGKVEINDVRSKLIEIWKRDNDSVQSFFFNMLEVDIDGGIVKTELHDRYKEYCEDNSFAKENIKSPRILMADISKRVTINETRPVIKNTQQTYCIGLRFKSDPKGNYKLLMKYGTQKSDEIDKIKYTESKEQTIDAFKEIQ